MFNIFSNVMNYIYPSKGEVGGQVNDSMMITDSYNTHNVICYDVDELYESEQDILHESQLKEELLYKAHNIKTLSSINEEDISDDESLQSVIQPNTTFLKTHSEITQFNILNDDIEEDRELDDDIEEYQEHSLFLTTHSYYDNDEQKKANVIPDEGSIDRHYYSSYNHDHQTKFWGKGDIFHYIPHPVGVSPRSLSSICSSSHDELS